MFRGLVAPPPTSSEAFKALKQKVEEASLPLVDLALTNFEVKFRAFTVETLLDNFDAWKLVPRTHPERSGQLTFLRTTIDGEMQGLRRRGFLMRWARFRRFYAACKLQAIVLKWLYSTGPDGLPPISRHDLLENFIVTTGADATIGELGDGDGDEAEEVPVDHPSPHPAKPSRREQISRGCLLPLLPSSSSRSCC